MSRAYPTPDFSNAFEWHVYYVYNDPEFKESCEELARLKYPDPKFVKLRDKISEKFCINPFFVNRYLNGGSADPELWSWDRKAPSFAWIKGHGDGCYYFIELTMHAHVKREDFIDMWKSVAKEKKKLGYSLRKKPPENPSLIYAIFKSRESNSFKEIYHLYSSGSLPNYTGSTGQYIDQESLERYYNKYRPGKK